MIRSHSTTDNRLRKWMNRIKDLWCNVFHNDPMWPLNGTYRCRRCLRQHVVTWEAQQSRSVNGSIAIPAP